MPRLSRAIADYIVVQSLAASQTSLSPGQIESPLSIDALDLDSAAKQRAHDQIVRTIDSIGFQTTFSLDAFSNAKTVGDLIDLLLATTGGRWRS